MLFCICYGLRELFIDLNGKLCFGATSYIVEVDVIISN